MKKVTIDRQKIKLFLKQTILFSGVDKSYIDKITKITDVYSVKKGENIILEKQYGRDIFLLVKGQLLVYFQNRKKRLALKLINPGDVFGEIGFFIKRRMASCEAIKDSTICMIKYKKFQNIVKKTPQILINIIKVLLKRLADTDLEIKNLAFKSVIQRLATEILSLSKGKNVVYIKTNVLVQKVAASRETVSRTLKLMENTKVIKRERNKIIILDRGKLTSLL